MLKAAGFLVLGFAIGVGVTVLFWPSSPNVLPECVSKVDKPAAIPPPTAVLPTGSTVPTGEDVFEQLTADPLGELDVTGRVAMMQWMTANPQYEFVTRDYCRCRVLPPPACPDPQTAIERADYPYLETGDFNKDGHKDIAIILALKGKQVPEAFLIFNGSFGGGSPKLAFSIIGLKRNDIVYNGFLGPTESDNGWTFEPKGETYELNYLGDP